MAENSLFLSVAEAYDGWSDLYDASDNPMVYAASVALATLLAEIPDSVSGRDVVELGCGTGRNLESFSRHGARSLVGCDLSPGMLRVAAERNLNLRLHCCDMAATPLPDGCADLALFCLSLEHVADLSPPLREAQRLLRPSGQLVIIELHPFLALTGVAAHFEKDGQEVRMPTTAHRFDTYLKSFIALGLSLTQAREWVPTDFGPAAPAKVYKRGETSPLLVEFRLTR